MNSFQAIWWQQARSDLETLSILREQGAAPCHQLHYLQMVCEKLGKAYFWRIGSPPAMGHAAFVRFLRTLGDVPQDQRQKLAAVFEFSRFQDFRSWIRSIMPLAYSLERLAPDLATDGPNPEYPWPHRAPVHAPADYEFAVWSELLRTGRGRRLVQVIRLAIERFPSYG
jgi:hypothetical protein